MRKMDDGDPMVDPLHDVEIEFEDPSVDLSKGVYIPLDKEYRMMLEEILEAGLKDIIVTYLKPVVQDGIREIYRIVVNSPDLIKAIKR
ncbi:MAG: hypothetical protein DRO01_03510 [Thermoproteota archaeon]|nr:MAG: hypothetical protein DRO01_03510 [Candidatus Korarchaeota archaeon]